MLSRLGPLYRQFSPGNHTAIGISASRCPRCFKPYSSKNQDLLPDEPYRTSFGILKVILTVVPGLLIGAAISKSIANFLEENDLFVPSDDDDDDD